MIYIAIAQLYKHYLYSKVAIILTFRVNKYCVYLLMGHSIQINTASVI